MSVGIFSGLEPMLFKANLNGAGDESRFLLGGLGQEVCRVVLQGFGVQISSKQVTAPCSES
jgi:hypothetical protein